MDKILRVYVAVQDNCEACDITKDVLNVNGLKGKINGVDIHIVDLTSDTERRDQMGVKSTPTLFIVEVEDEDNDGILEQIEEKHLWHQSGMIADSRNLRKYITALKEGKKLSTPI